MQCAEIAGSVALQTESGSVNRFLLVEPGGTVHLYDKRHLFRMADAEHLYGKAGNARVIVTARLAYFAAGVLRLTFSCVVAQSQRL